MARKISFNDARIWHRLDLAILKWGSAALIFLAGVIGDQVVSLLIGGALPTSTAIWSLLTISGFGFVVLPVMMWTVSHIANSKRELQRLDGMFDQPFFGSSDAALFEEISRGKFVVGSAVSVAVAPNLNRGWRLADVGLTLLDGAPAEPRALDENDGKKIAVRHVGLAGSDLKTLPINFEITRFSKVQAMRNLPNLEKLRLFSELDAGNFNFPNSFCIHAIVTTEDHRLLLTRRSSAVTYYPGAWSASLEEQLNYNDVTSAIRGRNALQEGALRMLAEELGLHPEVELEERFPFVVPDSMKCLTVFAETDVPNISTVIHVPLAMPAARLTRWLKECPRRDYEFTDFVLLNAEDVALELAKSVNLHPTSRYRMVLALRRWLGGKETVAACVRARSSNSVPLTIQRDMERNARMPT